ncbi:bactofilin family protein [Halosegnis marinus]|uniref:Polymer-forming cytoskeletal protein n=1 Tax=Halosegnis marinus TaxID=3034023 RepID=A0ABD5ZNY3_9EURY|nr:polymer-forming cytoskeletal protein [Halosegnis sp. DT85]
MSRLTRIGAALLAVCVLLSVAVAPVAAESRVGDTVVVGAGETIDGDLDVFAGTVLIRGTVTGDLNGAAGSIVVSGTVEGGVNAAAGTVTVTESGTVGGDLAVGAGTLTVDGTVLGDVTAGAATVALGPDARIAGDLRYDPDADLVGDRGAVEGSLVADDSLGFDAGPVVPPVVFDIYGLLVGLVVGAVLLYGAPGFSGRVTDLALDSPLRAGGVGLLAVVAAPVVFLLLLVTIVGIPLALVGAVVFGLFAWVGSLYGRLVVGTWLARALDREDSRVVVLFAGFLAVFVAVQVPVVGWLVSALVALLGLGALALALYGARRKGDDTYTPAIRPVA